MKKTKTMLLSILVGTVTFTVGLWLYSTKESLSILEYSVAALVLVAVIFSLIIGVKRMKDENKGLTVDDELSHQIKQKAASMAFMFSFYLWTMIILFGSDANRNIEIPIGIGILGMGVLFIGFWIYYSKNGIQK